MANNGEIVNAESVETSLYNKNQELHAIKEITKVREVIE